MKEKVLDDQTVGDMLTHDEVEEKACELAEKMMKRFRTENIEPRVVAIALCVSLVKVFIDWGFPLESLENITKVMISDYKRRMKKKEDKAHNVEVTT